MAENLSLADQAVRALAMVKAMDEGLEMTSPERHAIRNMKRVAQQAIEAGIRTATELAWQANDLRRLVREVEADKTPNAPHEGADAALSRTLPLEAVVGGAVSPAPTFGKG